MSPTILYRTDGQIDNAEELAIAKKYLNCITQRSSVKSGDTIVGRYSVLPYYKELEQDVLNSGSKLINSHRQHRYVADLANWYSDLEDLTPKTWLRPSDVPSNQSGSFFLKGETNSKKFEWNKCAFAKDQADISRVLSNLQSDSLIGTQSIYVREFVPLKTYLTGINGLPITDEYRFFICNGEVLTGAFYWSSAVEDIGFTPDVSNVPESFLQEVIKRVGNSVSFWVVDIAQTATGEWIVIELNDGQMSGLSENKPEALYSNLSRVLKNA